MRVLVACERSGVVREAFRKRGHDAWSCDLHPAQDYSEFHYQKDVRLILDCGWDLMIAHPECRRLCNSGVLRLYLDGKKRNGIDPQAWQEMEEAAEFYRQLADARHISNICIENSVMHGYAKSRTARPIMQGWQTQIIQPHQFGEDASKATRLQLKNLAPLKPTLQIAPRIVEGKPRWANQTDSGQNRLGPSPERSANRARTYQGIADAMAEQWG